MIRGISKHRGYLIAQLLDIQADNNKIVLRRFRNIPRSIMHISLICVESAHHKSHRLIDAVSKYLIKVVILKIIIISKKKEIFQLPAVKKHLIKSHRLH